MSQIQLAGIGRLHGGLKVGKCSGELQRFSTHPVDMAGWADAVLHATNSPTVFHRNKFLRNASGPPESASSLDFDSSSSVSVCLSSDCSLASLPSLVSSLGPFLDLASSSSA